MNPLVYRKRSWEATSHIYIYTVYIYTYIYIFTGEIYIYIYIYLYMFVSMCGFPAEDRNSCRSRYNMSIDQLGKGKKARTISAGMQCFLFFLFRISFVCHLLSVSQHVRRCCNKGHLGPKVRMWSMIAVRLFSRRLIMEFDYMYITYI